MSRRSEYPRFPDGDTLIIYTPTNHSWCLHSHVLRQSSRHFFELMDNYTSLSRSAKRIKLDGNAIQWKFIMSPRSGDERLFDFKELHHTARLPVASISRELDPVAYEHQNNYDNLFKWFYNIDVIFTSENNLVTDVVALLTAAEDLGAVPAVRRVLETYLLRLGQALWSHVAEQPGPYADLAIRLESPVIFREAMVHIIGQFSLPGGLKHDKSDDVNPDIMDLATKKVAEGREEKKTIEHSLLSFVPAQMRHLARNDIAPGRKDYANDIYHFMALTMVRQFLACSFHANMHHRATDGGAALYKALGESGDAYLNEEETQQFLNDNFQMTRKGEMCFEKAADEVKDSYKPVIAPLLVNNSLASGDFAYLTNAVIKDDEMPWLRPNSEDSETNGRIQDEVLDEPNDTPVTPAHQPNAIEDPVSPSSPKEPSMFVGKDEDDEAA